MSKPSSSNPASRRDPRSDSELYLENHNIRGLFKHLSTRILFSKPENPKDFLVEELKKVHACQREQIAVPPMFQEKDLMAIFGMFDVTGSGKISQEQVAKAMTNLGIEDYTAAPGNEQVDLPMFIATAQQEMEKIALRMPPLAP
mmetsp:Transcript_48430/g.115250  ORF Transcript_48430/g.115250 Transcript_48430/m.115250 type:complete len:144 (-) Transcript_48430:94-525(-)